MSMVNENAQAGGSIQGIAGQARNDGKQLISVFQSVKNLFIVKAKIARRGFLLFLAISALILLSSLAIMIYGIFSEISDDTYQYTGFVKVFTAPEFSVVFFAGLMFGFALNAFQYRRANDRLSVLPQTNGSRFISSLLINYSLSLCVGLTVLLMYLVSCAVMGLVAALVPSVHMGFGFNIGFVLLGFCAYMVYAFLVVAALDFAGVFIRKFPYVAGALATIFITLLVTAGDVLNHYLSAALEFLTLETSFGVFLLKAAGIWLAFTALSLLINHYTVYYKSKNPRAKTNVLIFTLACATVFAVSVYSVAAYNTAHPKEYPENTVTVNVNSDGSVEYIEALTDDEIARREEMNRQMDEYWQGYLSRLEYVRIDVSHLPKGSEIRLNYEEGQYFVVDAERMLWREAQWSEDWVDPLSDLQGDTVVVIFAPPYMEENGVEILHHLNARYSVRLEGDTLYFDYDTDEAYVVFVPVWRFASQFDITREKGSAFEGSFIYGFMDSDGSWYNSGPGIGTSLTYALNAGTGWYGGGMTAYTTVE